MYNFNFININNYQKNQKKPIKSLVLTKSKNLI